MIDFRYRVIDPEKASLILKKDSTIYLLDQATGTRLSIPITKLGPLKQSSLKPVANKVYFILFGNPGKHVKQGNKVTVVIADFREEDFKVQ